MARTNSRIRRRNTLIKEELTVIAPADATTKALKASELKARYGRTPRYSGHTGKFYL